MNRGFQLYAQVIGNQRGSVMDQQRLCLVAHQTPSTLLMGKIGKGADGREIIQIINGVGTSVSLQIIRAGHENRICLAQ